MRADGWQGDGLWLRPAPTAIEPAAYGHHRQTRQDFSGRWTRPQRQTRPTPRDRHAERRDALLAPSSGRVPRHTHGADPRTSGRLGFSNSAWLTKDYRAALLTWLIRCVSGVQR